MIAYFRNCLSVYNPPCPYTTACLEVMASVYNTKGIRRDVLSSIEKFAGLFKTDINLYFRRKISIPEISFDRHASFIKDNENNTILLCHPSLLLQNDNDKKNNNENQRYTIYNNEDNVNEGNDDKPKKSVKNKGSSSSTEDSESSLTFDSV